MHGLIFAELKTFVVATYGAPAWNDLLARAQMEGRIFLPNQVYADADAIKLVATASAMTGLPAAAVQEAFGEFIAPELIGLYKAQINPAWRTLDLVEKTEAFVHRAVRVKIPGAEPPRLASRRVSANEVHMEYASARQMCSLAVGIIRGVAKGFGETVEVAQPRCTQRGDASCLITTTLVRA